MVTGPLSRRHLLAGAVALGVLPRGLHADEIVDLTWRDLLPENQGGLPPELQDLVPHDETAMASQQPPSTGVRTQWNGRIVRLAGFVLPLDYTGEGVTSFLLVPFVGACIHVPPPPANQLVLVTTQTPYQSKGLFSPVIVTGMFGTAATRSQIADIGYALSADRIDPYRA